MAANDSNATKSIDPIHVFTKEGLDEFNAQLHTLVDDGKLANVVTLIARHSEIINCDAYGVLDVSATPPIPVKTDSIFRIASMTKPITAAAMMMLWEEGKWALEDSVSKFIPEFDGLKVKQAEGELVPQASPMSMKQLMSHSAGFGSRWEYPDLRSGDLQDMIDLLAKQPLSFQPGRGWRYGPSVDIQGYIIKKITGKHVDDFIEERIFAPLGMVDSGWVLPASKADRLVNNHKYDDDGKLVAIGLQGTYNPSRPKFLGAGGGLMLSTIKDYWRFCQMILNGGTFDGKRYLKASTVEMMHTNALEPGVHLKLVREALPGLGFGLGYAIVIDPAAARTSLGPHSYFWAGLYGTFFWIDPVNDMIVIALINHTKESSSLTGAPSVRELVAKLVYKMINESSGN
jgi:CubicO group peptidase (beta-lactamase class C family)